MLDGSEAAPRPGAVAGKQKKVRGVIYVNANRCKGCGFCIEFCPPKVLAFSSDYNTHGYHTPILAHPDGCTGCDLCGLYCPDFAIYGVMVREKPVTSRPAATPANPSGEATP